MGMLVFIHSHSFVVLLFILVGFKYSKQLHTKIGNFQRIGHLGLGILGEKKWREVISDLKTFAHTGCKIAAAIFVLFFTEFSYVHSV